MDEQIDHIKKTGFEKEIKSNSAEKRESDNDEPHGKWKIKWTRPGKHEPANSPACRS